MSEYVMCSPEIKKIIESKDETIRILKEALKYSCYDSFNIRIEEMTKKELIDFINSTDERAREALKQVEGLNEN